MKTVRNICQLKYQYLLTKVPYRTKIWRRKLSKSRLGVENFVRPKILSVENFVQYFNTKVRQKSDKSVEISAWCRKFCPTKYFVRRKFCPTKFCPIRYSTVYVWIHSPEVSPKLELVFLKLYFLPQIYLMKF